NTERVDFPRHAHDILVRRVAVGAPERVLVLRIEFHLRGPSRHDQGPLRRALQIDEEAVLARRHCDRPQHQRHFGLEPRRLIRAGAPDWRRWEARGADAIARLALVGPRPEGFAAGRQWTPVGDLVPFAVLVGLASGREGGTLAFRPGPEPWTCADPSGLIGFEGV